MDHPAGPCYCWYRVEGGVEGEGVGLLGTMKERIREEENVGGKEEHKMKGRSEEINLILTSAEQLEQITPIIQERCVEELCGPVALWVSEDVLAFIKVCVWLILYLCVCAGGKGRGGGGRWISVTQCEALRGPNEQHGCGYITQVL